MVIATFTDPPAWAGKTLNYDDGALRLEGHGTISVHTVVDFDRRGQITWAYEGLREWVQQLAADAEVQPAQAVELSAPLSSPLSTPKRRRATASSSRKWIRIAIAVLALGSVVSRSSVFNHDEPVPQGTKTFTSVAGGYRFDYPARFTVTTPPTYGDPAFSTRLVDGTNSVSAAGAGECWPTIIVQADAMKGTFTDARIARTIRLIVRDMPGVPKDDPENDVADRTIITAKVVRFGKIPMAACESTWRTKDGGTLHSLSWMFYWKAKLYNVEVVAGETSWPANRPELQQILDSFTLL